MAVLRGSEVTRRRQLLGIKPGKFAGDVGVSYSHLANVVSGRREASTELVHRFATRLGCDAGELLAGEAA